MQRWKALIVDDERLARKELRSMLAEHSIIDIIGEAENVEQALQFLRMHKPDVLFLDIQMPGQSGFQLLEQIQPTFKVIFVTAYDAYAIRAFEVNALDYLLKPINPARLAQAIERLMGGGALPVTPARKLDYDDRLFVESGERSYFLNISAIVSVQAADDYSEVLRTDGQKSLILKSLREWEERLPEKHFTRIHRSAIVNLNYVDKIESWFNRSYRLYLRNVTEPLQMSRRYAAKLKEKFG